MVKIGNVEISGLLTLAPMAGVTDFAFRAICTELGAALTTTEMVSAKALCYGDNKTKSLLYNLPGCRPFAAQIFGHEPGDNGTGSAYGDRIFRRGYAGYKYGLPGG